MKLPSVYAALLVSQVDSDNPVEPSSGGYARIEIVPGSTDELFWANEALTPWPVSGLAIFDKPRGGDIVKQDGLGEIVTILLNDVFRIRNIVFSHEVSLSASKGGPDVSR